MEIVILVLTIVLTWYFVSKKYKVKIRENEKVNLETLRLNKEIRFENEELERKSQLLSQEYKELVNKYDYTNTQHQALLTQHNNILNQYNTLTSQLGSAQAKHIEYQKTEKQYKDNISRLKSINDAAIDAAKRAEELRVQQDFYKIQLSNEDIEEITKMREIESFLRNKEPLNKIIWKCYYEKPTTDLIGRVIGTGVVSGIYKITEISTGKCYVGQSVNIAERWKQHIKRGVGAETPTQNKLYPAMREIGPENFTFEIIEKCNKASLDEREDYWQDYFQAKEFGFSIK